MFWFFISTSRSSDFNGCSWSTLCNKKLELLTTTSNHFHCTENIGNIVNTELAEGSAINAQTYFPHKRFLYLIYLDLLIGYIDKIAKTFGKLIPKYFLHSQLVFCLLVLDCHPMLQVHLVPVCVQKFLLFVVECTENKAERVILYVF